MQGRFSNRMENLLIGKQRRMKMFMIMQDVSHQLFTDSVLEEVLLGMEEEDKR